MQLLHAESTIALLQIKEVICGICWSQGLADRFLVSKNVLTCKIWIMHQFITELPQKRQGYWISHDQMDVSRRHLLKHCTLKYLQSSSNWNGFCHLFKLYYVHSLLHLTSLFMPHFQRDFFLRERKFSLPEREKNYLGGEGVAHPPKQYGCTGVTVSLNQFWFAIKTEESIPWSFLDTCLLLFKEKLYQLKCQNCERASYIPQWAIE